MTLQVRVSYSGIDTYRSCPRRYYYSNVERWETVSQSRPLAFGTAFHGALEAWWGAGSEPAERLSAALRAWGLEAPRRGLCPEDVVLGEVLLQGYTAMWHEDHTEGARAELPVVVPVLGPDGPAEGLTLKGVLDVDLDESVVEHKTTTSDIKPGGSYWQRLERNLQIPLYFILREDMGRPIDSILWDVVRAPEWRLLPATPPEKREFYLRNGKYGKKGDPKPGTRLEPETMEDFRERATKAILDKPEEFFQRKRIYRTEEDLEKVRADLYSYGRLIQASHESGLWPRNESNCSQFRRECDFAPVCHRGVDVATSALYRKREKQLHSVKQSATIEAVKGKETA